MRLVPVRLLVPLQEWDKGQVILVTEPQAERMARDGWADRVSRRVRQEPETEYAVTGPREIRG